MGEVLFLLVFLFKQLFEKIYRMMIVSLLATILVSTNHYYIRVKARAETKALIGGCIFIYSRSARRISFEISCHYS